jgi:heptosyltransferase-3
MTGAAPRRILILRTGSIGDGIVALPVLHALARAYPEAERRVLTNAPINSDAATLESVLGTAGPIDGYFHFPVSGRGLAVLRRLREEIRAWRPDLAVYASEPRAPLRHLRDWLFLRACGAARIAGIPFSGSLRRHGAGKAAGLLEAEASRLARCIAPVAEARLADPASWSLALTAAERAEAEAALADWAGAQRFVAFGIGAKIEFKSWGDDRWQAVLAGLTAADPALGLALIGGPNDSPRALAAAEGWQGPVLDLCGRLSPRLSAAVIARAALYLGHDSGPMHLAASVGTPAVAVFSTHARPGIWFPFGAGHRVFYPGLGWSGGDPAVTRDAAGETNITLIPPAPVLAACLDQLGLDGTGGAS